ncbi:MAG TPA: response regulator transcription factor [Candidatus Polarisedimenticolia bacterium]|jgi:DNA-binding response OmpR family regulator|nr:response regulator transcription factor [Candidatus Polarisedimenticolia bacterium]
MRILIAEDDLVSRKMLEATLTRWGYEVLVTCDGQAALQALTGPDAPRVAILDWMMPSLDGVDVCRRVREGSVAQPPYVILLTAKGNKEDIVSGLEAGADDYIIKPFDREELRARLQAGLRIITLQNQLAARVRELEEAIARIRTLQGLLPICSYCKRVRNDGDYWQQVESYISDHSDARFSHGICPDCYESVVRPQLQTLTGERKAG